MRLEQSFDVAAPLERVWRTLIDVEQVAPCLPGAAVTGRNEDGSYAGTFTVKIGPTTASYSGRLEMESVDEAAHTATMQAQGTDKRGQGGAKATIYSRLAPANGAGTRVDVVTDYHITGRLARFGRGGMIEEISNRLLREFAKRLQTSIVAEADTFVPGEQPPVEAPGAPVAESPVAPAPESVAPEAVEPEAVTPEAVEPEAVAPAPEAPAPGTEQPPADAVAHETPPADEAAEAALPPAEVPPAEPPPPPAEVPAAEAPPVEATAQQSPPEPAPPAPPVHEAAPPPPAPGDIAPPVPPPSPVMPPAQPRAVAQPMPETAEPMNGLALVGSVLWSRVKANPAPVIAGAAFVLLIARRRRKRRANPWR